MAADSRYAIYFLPAPGSALAERGAAWLGRDALTGGAVAQHLPDGIDAAAFREKTESARRYGFHATLKAPIHLKEGVDEAAFLEAVADHAGRRPRFPLGPLSPKWIGPFLALTPDSPDPQHVESLQAWTFDIVRALDPFRAPMGPEEAARRDKGLDDRQRQLLKRWGYPYVADQFRFHMTLSAPLPEGERPVWRDAARRWFAPALETDQRIDALSVAVERDPPGPFVELARLKLRG